MPEPGLSLTLRFQEHQLGPEARGSKRSPVLMTVPTETRTPDGGSDCRKTSAQRHEGDRTQGSAPSERCLCEGHWVGSVVSSGSLNASQPVSWTPGSVPSGSAEKQRWHRGHDGSGRAGSLTKF